MDESSFSIKRENDTIKITLSGNLDAKNAPALSEEFKKILSGEIKRIVFFVKELKYISSAGLRVIIFAKQKLGDEAEVVMVGVQEDVLEVIKMSGLDTIMEFKDIYEG
ncbi:MAG: hypothetical protein AMS17_14380 [Spirochaetes bacterium DG_61]|nr:MAG: hypothetical protein AMS17_14380 [Spirochaetes bacterium DG_61]